MQLQGLWTGPQLQWHINCLELLAVWLALRRFKMLLHEKDVLVCTDNTATVAYINQQCLCSRRMSQLARHLLLWSQKHLRSLRAVHVPGELNRAADKLSHQPALPGEWGLHPEVLQLIWRRFGDTQVDLVCLPGHVPLPAVFLPVRGDPRYRRAGTQLVSGPTQICVSPSEPSRTDPVQGQGGRGASPFGAPYWPNRTWFPELMLLATAPPWQIPLRRDLISQREGTLWHPSPDLRNLHVWSLDRTRRF